MNHGMNHGMNTDDRQIININEADWFQTLDYCPKTLNQMKLFIEIMDRMKILKSYNLDLIVIMDHRRLNILFALLKITNKFFDGYSDQLTKKILKPRFMKLFDTDKHSIILDQLIQDSDGVITDYVSLKYPNISSNNLETILYSNFKKSLESDFYRRANIIVPKSYDEVATEIVSYTIKSMKDIHTTVNVFLSDIFGEDTEDNRIDQLVGLVLNNMNFEKIMYEQCAEINIYNEYYRDLCDPANSRFGKAESRYYQDLCDPTNSRSDKAESRYYLEDTPKITSKITSKAVSGEPENALAFW